MASNNLAPQSQAFLDRIKTGVSSSIDLSRLSTWLEKNTTHPKDNTKPWSFKDHEFQIGIVNDTARKVVVRKCSQVGLSELIARMTLALLAVLRNHTAIYTMPTARGAADFARSRFDPAIANSAVLREMVNSNLDNVQLKQLGSSFLYTLGTFTQKAAISIPADILINDETDFSNQAALTTFSSRLGHAVDGGIKREFSTPTVNGFGISKSFDTSGQAYFAVKCNHCRKWVFPHFLNNVIIPGYDDEIEKFESEDLDNPLYDIRGAFIQCPECRGPLTQENLANPEKRQWISWFPDREVHGYQVFPYDVPTINPISKTLSQIREYERKADWVNFKLGLPFEDAESSFLLEAVKNNIKVEPQQPPQEISELSYAPPTGAVMGVDVGKTSWVIVGKPAVGSRRMNILWMERIKQDGEGVLLKRLVQLVKWFGVSKAVIDAGPDFTTSMAFVNAFYMGRVFANYYVRTKSRNTLSHITINDEEGITNTVRTEALDLLAKRVNAGYYLFPRMKETLAMQEHLTNIKRVETTNNQGDLVATWVSNGPDHYAHALNYLTIADTLLDKRFQTPGVVGVLPMATVARLKVP